MTTSTKTELQRVRDYLLRRGGLSDKEKRLVRLRYEAGITACSKDQEKGAQGALIALKSLCQGD